MCTAISWKNDDFYMGRTLDYECSYGEEITFTPRQYPFRFRYDGELSAHYALLGTAHVAQDYPLYYDAVNECGLGMAGLNFVGNAVYAPVCAGKRNVAQFELIPFILSQCATLTEARGLLQTINLTGDPFSAQFPTASLHWMIGDRSGTMVLESMRDGLHIYDNPAGVLTNNPPFDWQMTNLSNYMALSPAQPAQRLGSGSDLRLVAYSRGMGALGLPGDLSSASRFVRAAFSRANALAPQTEASSVVQMFHLFGTVEQIRGCCEVEKGKYEITIYTGLWNADKGIYYYTTYENSQVHALDMHRENAEGNALVRYPMQRNGDFCLQNQ